MYVVAGVEGIRLIRFGTNRGSGSARRAGTAAAKGRVTVWTDADIADVPPVDFREGPIEKLAPYRQPVLATDRGIAFSVGGATLLLTPRAARAQGVPYRANGRSPASAAASASRY